jgi:hypothetical protein
LEQGDRLSPPSSVPMLRGCEEQRLEPLAHDAPASAAGSSSLSSPSHGS